jgi:hypothetical protein
MFTPLTIAAATLTKAIEINAIRNRYFISVLYRC